MPRIPALPRHQNHPCGQLVPQEGEFGQGLQVSPGGNHACPSLLAPGALTPEPGAGTGQALGNGISREPSPGRLKLLPEWSSTPFPVNCCKKNPDRANTVQAGRAGPFQNQGSSSLHRPQRICDRDIPCPASLQGLAPDFSRPQDPGTQQRPCGSFCPPAVTGAGGSGKECAHRDAGGYCFH